MIMGFIKGAWGRGGSGEKGGEGGGDVLLLLCWLLGYGYVHMYI